MRIISGKAGSIPLRVPKSLTRPTTDRVREAMFSALGDIVIGANVLDLFAGSGSLGIESLSRGATSVTFVESNDAACKVLTGNLEKANLKGGKVMRQNVSSYLSRTSPGEFDLIFADPPYARDDGTREALHSLLGNGSLQRALKDDGIFVLESLASDPLPEMPLWKTVKEKTYGTTRVSYLVAIRP